MTKIQKFKTIILLSVFCFLLPAPFAFAAETFFQTENQDIRVGDQFEAGFFLNTGGEDINAVEGSILFPADLLELKEIRDGNSIITLWIERPRIVSGGEIRFSGIIPGGYTSKKGLILSMVFQARTEGGGVIGIRDARTLRNDGEGSEAQLSVSNLQFETKEAGTAAQIQLQESKDADPPELFTPEIASDPAIFEGRRFLVFATQDKGAGIDRYEIKEIRSKGVETGEWVPAESPYLLKDQKLRSYIYVKAIDRAGNERVAILPPQKPLTGYENFLARSIIILGALIACFIGGILWKKYRAKIR